MRADAQLYLCRRGAYRDLVRTHTVVLRYASADLGNRSCRGSKDAPGEYAGKIVLVLPYATFSHAIDLERYTCITAARDTSGGSNDREFQANEYRGSRFWLSAAKQHTGLRSVVPTVDVHHISSGRSYHGEPKRAVAHLEHSGTFTAIFLA
jgi:hypothetical protein